MAWATSTVQIALKGVRMESMLWLRHAKGLLSLMPYLWPRQVKCFCQSSLTAFLKIPVRRGVFVPYMSTAFTEGIEPIPVAAIISLLKLACWMDACKHVSIAECICNVSSWWIEL